MRILLAQSFDFAMFSNNGIDYMAQKGRLQALREIARVLKPHAPFFFMSHNRRFKYAGKLPWQRTDRLLSPRFWIHCLIDLRYMPKHARLKRLEVHSEHYDILNDGQQHYSHLTYYIDAPAQIAQLRQCGFGTAQAYDTNLRPIETVGESPWLYYLARK